MTRYVIIGAGAIGSVIAARLAQHCPHQAVLVARGDNAKTIAEQGIHLRTPDEDVHVPVDVVTSPDQINLRPNDVLVFATKTQQVQAALLEWVDRPVDGTGAIAGDVLPVVMALNGVESERLAQRLFATVIGAAVWLPAAHLAPGEVIVRFAPLSGAFIVGPCVPKGTVPNGTPVDPGTMPTLGSRTATDALQADWQAAGFDVHVLDDVRPWKYRKLVMNLGNAIDAILGPGQKSDSAADILAALTSEAQAVLTAAGVTLPSDEDEALWRGDGFVVRPVPGVDRALGTSSWQSIVRGSGSIETDYLNGEIVLIARQHGLDAPLNATMQRIARQAAAGHVAPGSMTPDELRALLGI